MSSFHEDDENYCGDTNIIVSSSTISSKDRVHGLSLSSSSLSTTFKEYNSSTMLSSSSPATSLSIINVKTYSPSSQHGFICDHSASHASTEMNNTAEEEPTNSPNSNDVDHSIVSEGLHLTVFRVTNDVTYNSNESETNEADKRSNTDEDSTVEDNDHQECTDTATTTVGVETTPERIAREERESQELVWELMRQDNQEVYSMQMQFMQENADHLSAEDFALIQSLVNESAQQNNVLVASRDGVDNSNDDDDGQGEDNGDGGDEDNNGIDENDPNTWDYERLLALGRQMGDVKTERWRLRSRSVINQLKKLIYADILQCKMSETHKGGSVAETETGSVVDASLVNCHEDVMTNKEHVVGSPTTNDDYNDAVVEEEHSSSNKKPCLRSEIDTPCDHPILFIAANTNATNTSLLDGNTTSTTTTTAAAAAAGCDISRRVDDVDRCVVCMEDFEPSDLLLQLPCRHFFHVPCTEVGMSE